MFHVSMKAGNKDKTKKEFEELLLEVRRVTRVTTGGRKLSFRATILVGNKRGKIWMGISKWLDVSSAVSKASREAYKNMFLVPITEGKSVPYVLTTKYKACRVRLLPASAGTGLKAGSSVRAVLELAWYENMLSKIIGSNNKLNNALATIKALCSYKYADFFNKVIAEPVMDEEEETTAPEGEVHLKMEWGKLKVESGDLKVEDKDTPADDQASSSTKPVKKVIKK